MNEPAMQALLNSIAALTAPPAEACRVFHGRGGLHPGCEHLALDAWPPVWLLTSFEPLPDTQLADIGQALATRWQAIAPGQPLNWVFQQRSEAGAVNRLMHGQVPDEHVVGEAGLHFEVHLLQGLNHGFFLDMAEGRRWVRQWAAQHAGGRVLNLFAYTGAFSVVALAAGAASVVNVDMARGALATARRNHARNGVGAGASFLAHDIFNTWGKIGRSGPYDLVVMDPPSYQKGSFVATKDYARLVRRLPELLAPGGHALLCLNTPKLGLPFLTDLLRDEAPGMVPLARLPNPPAFADVADERALKVLVARRR
jgi:23S rRNA (cytosine1962-C5)-methyltransferase